MRLFLRFVVLTGLSIWLLVVSSAARGAERTARELLFDAVLWANSAALDRALARGASLETRNDKGDTPLLWAVKGGAVRGEELLLKRGANVHARDRNGVSVWHAALQECIPLLVRHGANVNERNAQAGTRLMGEVTSSEEYLVRLLLEHGADPNLRDNKGETALMLADSQYVPLLLAHGADIDARDKRGETTLMKWIWHSDHRYSHDAKEVKMLLQRGANVHLAHPKGSAIERAAKYINMDIVRAMLKVPSLTKRERALLQRAILSDELFGAANEGDVELTRSLLRRGADPNVVLNDSQYDGDSLTPLMIAAQRSPDRNADKVLSAVALREEARDVEVSRLLLGRGADPDYQFELPIGGLNDNFALQYAAAANKPRLVKLLLRHSAKPNLRGEGGATALFAAISNPAVVRVLLHGGANANAPGALLNAAYYGHPEVVRMLLACGANPNIKSKQSPSAPYEDVATPLIAAVRHHTYDERKSEARVQREGVEIARMLLHAGARVNERDPIGQSALLHAAAFGNLSLAQMLLRAGAATESRDNEGQTPLMAACAGRYYALTSAAGAGLLPPNPDIAALLLRHGADPNARDKTGSTPLILAVRYDWRHSLWRALIGSPKAYAYIRAGWSVNAIPAKRCLELLLRHGANPNRRDKQGRTARDWAKAQGNRDMTRLLQRAM